MLTREDLKHEIDQLDDSCLELVLRLLQQFPHQSQDSFNPLKPSSSTKKEEVEKSTEPFGERLKEFLKEVETDPVDIDTAIFDNYRKSVTARDFKWED